MSQLTFPCIVLRWWLFLRVLISKGSRYRSFYTHCYYRGSSRSFLVVVKVFRMRWSLCTMNDSCRWTAAMRLWRRLCDSLTWSLAKLALQLLGLRTTTPSNLTSASKQQKWMMHRKLHKRLLAVKIESLFSLLKGHISPSYYKIKSVSDQLKTYFWTLVVFKKKSQSSFPLAVLGVHTFSAAFYDQHAFSRRIS